MVKNTAVKKMTPGMGKCRWIGNFELEKMGSKNEIIKDVCRTVYLPPHVWIPKVVTIKPGFPLAQKLIPRDRPGVRSDPCVNRPMALKIDLVDGPWCTQNGGMMLTIAEAG